jgi:hypothetical protein
VSLLKDEWQNESPPCFFLHRGRGSSCPFGYNGGLCRRLILLLHAYTILGTVFINSKHSADWLNCATLTWMQDGVYSFQVHIER